jgi:hypothetical protein
MSIPRSSLKNVSPNAIDRANVLSVRVEQKRMHSMNSISKFSINMCISPPSHSASVTSLKQLSHLLYAYNKHLCINQKRLSNRRVYHSLQMCIIAETSYDFGHGSTTNIKCVNGSPTDCRQVLEKFRVSSGASCRLAIGELRDFGRRRRAERRKAGRVASSDSGRWGKLVRVYKWNERWQSLR